jgi:hypothetical protein
MLIGYDIACQHCVTAHNHPLTGNLVRDNETGYANGAFHGYAHERSCQLDWHPLYKDGAGMEDFETCERFFSHSNDVARCTQHASKRNRREQIHQHMEASDKDAIAHMGEYRSISCTTRRPLNRNALRQIFIHQISKRCGATRRFYYPP